MEELINKTGHRLFLPFYHCVADDTPLHIKHLYKPRSIKEFESDLDFFCKYFEPISLEDVIGLNGKQPAKPSFHITFDDGLSEFYYNVVPILKRKNIPATAFLNTDFVDNQQLFYRFKASLIVDFTGDELFLKAWHEESDDLDEKALELGLDFSTYLKEKTPYMTWNQIKELQAEGITFGAHSKDHPHYSKLDLERQMVQTLESLDLVQANLNAQQRVFSFPFTDDGVTKSFFESIRKDVDVTFGCAGIKDDIDGHFQRLGIEGKLTAEDLVKQEYSRYLVKKKIGKHIITRQ